jgi:hypothetical protein
MTAAEEQQLRELSAELAAQQTSPWQPRCIAAAWRSSVPSSEFRVPSLTMQGWIDLDAIRSPLLVGDLPELEEMEATARAFGVSDFEFRVECPEAAAALAVEMQAAVARAFSAALKMLPPNPEPGTQNPEPADDGFGDWMPLLAFLVTEARLTPDDALALRVDRAFMLMAAIRRNQGWRVAGQAYALRATKEEA